MKRSAPHFRHSPHKAAPCKHIAIYFNTIVASFINGKIAEPVASIVGNDMGAAMQKGISYVGRYLSDLSDNFDTLQDVRDEKDALQTKVDELTIENTGSLPTVRSASIYLKAKIAS